MTEGELQEGVEKIQRFRRRRRGHLAKLAAATATTNVEFRHMEQTHSHTGYTESDAISQTLAKTSKESKVRFRFKPGFGILTSSS